MGYGYAWKKMHSAALLLSGPGPQQERIFHAVVFNLIQIVPENDLPQSMHIDFKGFMSDVKSVQPKGREGSVHATVYSLDEMECSRVVEKIMDFYGTICTHHQPS